ncbi:MAG: formate dehydrogenase subunit delta [Methylococcaceae bacterium]|nr:formate dehydrogenase subunit delta [Methylococcaceae bacterium]
MHIENLVRMTNDIVAFFQSDPDRSAAVRGVVEHLSKFWEPRMRKRIIAHCREGGVGLSDLAKEAVKHLEQDAASVVSKV